MKIDKEIKLVYKWMKFYNFMTIKGKVYYTYKDSVCMEVSKEWRVYSLFARGLQNKL